MMSVTYGSTKKLVRKLAEESGFQVDEAPLTFPLTDEAEILESLDSVLKPNTTLVILDLIPSNAPFVLPPEAIELCRSKAPDAFLLLDAAHGLLGRSARLGTPQRVWRHGGWPLKLSGPRREYPVDAVMTNCHKWFCGAKGTALLHVSEPLQEWLEPLVISHGYGSDLPSGFYWPGLADWSSFLALDEAMAFWDLATRQHTARAGVGLDAARTYCNYMVRDAAMLLADAWGTDLGLPEEVLSTMALVRLPDFAAQTGERLTYEEAEAVQNALYTRNIEVPVKALSGKLYVRRLFCME
ncbi:Putative L-cysteine desulfhydrase 1 (OsL-CDes1) (L-CDes1) [Durusdinium trenchii]|uniref:L-cysteine desulfhydrase 1 (OsL-CDes1) (L-CDes1) n=1 Tax=Durusdinium trenchii TaxID=1381693 RepID=A0ABP0PKN5_9DINO